VKTPLRVAFAGASGTGKSTLAEWVAHSYNLPLNPIGARSVAAEMGFASPYDVDKAGKRAEFQQRLLAAKMAWEAEHESFVTDRTTLDNLTYTALHDVHAIDAATLNTAGKGCERYTHIIVCCIESFFDTAGDPARIADAAYHTIYETLLISFLERGRFATVRGLEFSSLEERKQELRVALQIA